MPIALFAVAIFSLFQPAHARTIEIDGERYECERVPEGSPDGALSCVNKAFSGPFSREDSAKLCEGARSDAPASCAIRAYSGPFTNAESIQLCKGARSLGPIECAELAYSGPFGKEETLELCANRRATKANAECALKAYSGPYGKSESIKMCKPQISELQFSSSNSPRILAKDELEAVLIAANRKAFEKHEYKNKR